MLEELLEVRKDLYEAFKAGDIVLVGFGINKLDTFMYNNQNKLKQ